MGDDKAPDLGKKSYKNTQGILLTPNPKLGEIGVLHCSIPALNTRWPKPILIRARIKNNGKEYSEIKLASLSNPTTISNPITLISPIEQFEGQSCEDPHIEKDNNKYYITYVVVSQPNAQIALATASEDFSKITKHGIISPNISLEEAINLVPSEKYKNLWQLHLNGIKKINPEATPKLYVKDGLLHKEGNVWYFIYRIEPDAQIAMVTDLNDLHKDNFWRNEIKNFDKRTFMKAEDNWEKLKIGIGAIYHLNKTHLGLYHGVSGEKNHLADLHYSGSFFTGRFSNHKFSLEAKLKNPLLVPQSEDSVLIEPGCKKAINFLTAAVIDPENPDLLFLYYGLGDREIKYKTASISQIMHELGYSQNKKAVC